MRLMALTLSALLLLAPGGGGGQDKVTICHKGDTITIGAPAVDAHQRNHGDTIGACTEGGIGPVEPPVGPTTTTTTLPPEEPPIVTTEPPPDHSHDPHSHDELVLRCTVIDT